MAGDNHKPFEKLDRVTTDVKKALDEFLGLTISNTGKRRAALEMRMGGLIRMHVQLERSRAFATVQAANGAAMSVIANGGAPSIAQILDADRLGAKVNSDSDGKPATGL